MEQSERQVDPVEWDFRSVKSLELPAVTIYEYARSCPKVFRKWMKWLNSSVPTCREIEMEELTFTYDEQNRVRVRDVFRQEYPCGIPAWPRDATASLLVGSVPALFRDLAIEPLVFCTPSFPKPWAELPLHERESVLALLGRPQPRPVRDAKDKPDPGEHIFKLAIDIDLATPTDIQKGFKVWLKQKLIEFEKQNPTMTLAHRKANIGRQAAPLYEALTWLGAYRFQLAELSYKDAYPEVQRRWKDPQHKDPASGRFPKLPVFDVEDGWYKAIARAKDHMDNLFIPSGETFVRSIFLRLW